MSDEISVADMLKFSMTYQLVKICKEMVESGVDTFREKLMNICKNVHDDSPDGYIKTYRIHGTLLNKSKLSWITIKAPNELCALILYAEHEYVWNKRLDHYEYYYELLSKDNSFESLTSAFFSGDPDSNPFEESFSRGENIEINIKSVKPFEFI